MKLTKNQKALLLEFDPRDSGNLEIFHTERRTLRSLEKKGLLVGRLVGDYSEAKLTGLGRELLAQLKEKAA